MTGASELHDLIKPYLLRRTKEVVLKDLPKKSDLVMYHGISKVQKKLYKAILTKDISKAVCKWILCLKFLSYSLKTLRLNIGVSNWKIALYSVVYLNHMLLFVFQVFLTQIDQVEVPLHSWTFLCSSGNVSIILICLMVCKSYVHWYISFD